MEVSIAEANGISRNKYNELIYEGLELPECIKKYREINRKKQLHEEKLIKHELKENGLLASKPPALLLVFTYYPLFQEDYKLLLKNEYFIETQNGLKWLKTKKSLAEYFGYQVQRCERTPWQAIEILFEVKNLKNSFNQDGEKSPDYKELNKILVRRNTPKSKDRTPDRLCPAVKK
jgi:hypothetical protein